MNKPKQSIWFHGTKEEFSGPLKPIYLTSSKALASMHGNVYKFKIDDDAKWFNIDEAEYFVPSMDSIGYMEGWAEKFRNKGWDVIWDKADYTRGYKQIYVVNPGVLEPIKEINETPTNLGSILRLPLGKLIVFRSSLFSAFDDCSRGKCTRSTGPIEVFRASDGYQLLDGHHRLIEYLLKQKHLENSHSIPAKVRTGPGTLDYAVADFDERWEYDGSLKYGNLEDLADEEILDDLVVELFHINEAKIDTLLDFLFETTNPSAVLYHGSPNKFDQFEQKPWKAFDGKMVKAPIWLSPEENFATKNAGPNGWIYEVETNNLTTFPDQELRAYEGNYIVPTKLGEKLIEDMVTFGMFGLGEDDWYEAEEILKSIDRLDYDTLETGDFIEWLKRNGYNSFMVRGDGPTNLAVLNADNLEIVSRKRVSQKNNLKEALEYNPEDELYDVKYPDFIKKLAKEVELLDRKVQKAYEENNPRVVELDVLFARKQEELETALSELEDEPKETDFEDQIQSGGQEELLRQFASIYRHWHEKIPYQGVELSERDLLEFLRSWAQDYGYRLGGFKKETTDEQLLDAAKDSYERMKYLITRKPVAEHKRSSFKSFLLFLEGGTKMDKTIEKVLFEEISPPTKEKIETAKPNDTITVYHGTPKMRIPDLINGFDATQVVPRDYGGAAHRGLFVTPDPEVAKGFGGGAVFELKVPAKFIHGTDWGGLTGRDIEREKGKGALDWVKEKFPNSFRPWMSYTMLSSGAEPQGILIGTVKPSQITRIWVRDLKTNEWKEYTRKEYLDTKDYYNVRRILDKNKYEYIYDAGIHLADPKLKLKDFAEALAEFEGGYTSQKYIDLFVRSYERDPGRLIETLKSIEIGGSRLGGLALKNILKQIKQRSNSA